MLVSKIKQSTKKHVLSLHSVTRILDNKKYNKEPFLCIITPIFDPALGSLKKLIEGLRGQSYGNFIHISVSNGPSKKIQDYIKKIEKKDPRFQYVELDYIPTHDFASTIANSGLRRDYCLQKFNARRYQFLDADAEIVDKDYFSKLYFAHKFFKKDILVTTIDYHGAILPVHPVDKEGNIAIGNYSFSKKIAKNYRYPSNYDNISYQGNDYRYWKKISKKNDVLFLDFISVKEGGNRSYKRMNDKKLEEGMANELIPVFKNDFSDLDIEGIKEVLDSHIVGYGKKVKEFEVEFAHYIGFKYGVATNSCTNAFWVLLKALDFKKSDEVIIPSIHFFGIKNVLELHGISYKVADVEPTIPNISLELLKKAITKKTKAIIFLEYGGYPLEITKIKRYLKSIGRNDIQLILDAANSPFTKVNGKYSALEYDYAVYSFDMNKILVTGEGGMILSNRKEITEKCHSIAYYGILDNKRSGFAKSQKGEKWWLVGKINPSLKLAMNSIAASLGLTQLKLINANLQGRDNSKKLYIEKLQRLVEQKKVVLPPQNNKVENANYLFWLILEDEKTRDELAKFLLQKNIYTTVKYEPLADKKKTPVAWDFFERSLCIPFNRDVSILTDYIVAEILEFFYEK